MHRTPSSVLRNMSTPALTDDMKVVLAALRQSLVLANQELLQHRRALDIYARQCGDQLGIDLEKWTLNVDAMMFVPRSLDIPSNGNLTRP